MTVANTHAIEKNLYGDHDMIIIVEGALKRSLVRQMGQANKWTRRNYFSGRKEDGKKEVNRNRVVKKWSSDHYENESGIKRNSRRCNFFYCAFWKEQVTRRLRAHLELYSYTRCRECQNYAKCQRLYIIFRDVWLDIWIISISSNRFIV